MENALLHASQHAKHHALLAIKHVKINTTKYIRQKPDPFLKGSDFFVLLGTFPSGIPEGNVPNGITIRDTSCQGGKSNNEQL